ncbi:unnamed protein product, partial [Allacma fusca]
EVKISEDEILPKYSSTEVYQKQLPTTPPPQELTIEIGSPLDMPHLPGMKKIHLTITGGHDWRTWTRDNAQQVQQVSSLRLKGTVSPLEILHFLSSFKNLTSLRIENLTGKLCGKRFNVKSQTLSHDNLEYLGITHVEDNPCSSAYQFFKDGFEFPKLRRVEIVNLPIDPENERYFLEFFKKIEHQLTQLDLQNVLVRVGSQAFANLEFKNLVSLHCEFREPNSEGAKSVFRNLNRATPNLVEVSTNVVCTQGEKLAFDANWSKINGSKRMICDVHSSK